MDLSLALKNRRRQLGLTLTQLARRVRTSPATISRYESGWNRFELYTLQKLASALGCSLRIELEPIRRQGSPALPAVAVARLGRLFWDKPLQEADLVGHPRWVIQRVLEFGTLPDVRILVQLLGKAKVLEEAGSIRFRSPKTSAFWSSLRELEGGPCFVGSCRKAVNVCWQK